MAGSGVEIERKFLAKSMPNLDGIHPLRITQGYLKMPDDGLSEVRVRLTKTHDGQECGYLTVKSCGDIERIEVESQIDPSHAKTLFDLCQGALIEKERYPITVDGVVFEVDVYRGAHEGLITVDVELLNASAPIPTPEWLGQEVSSNPMYKNAHLARTAVLVRGFTRKQ